jgi:hypothetical protein
MATPALTGRAGLQGPLTAYLEEQPHIPPSTWRFDPSGEQAPNALAGRASSSASASADSSSGTRWTPR